MSPADKKSRTKKPATGRTVASAGRTRGTKFSRRPLAPPRSRRTTPRKSKKAARPAARPKAALARGRAVFVRPEAAAPATVPRAQLLAIDVLLYHGKGLISNAIRFFDGTDVSHASLFIAGAAPSVDEAIAQGLVQRSLASSVADSAWVRARRLKTPLADVGPVLAKAEFYLKQKERYAYEQILLMAFLCLIRKPKITPIFRALVLAVLEKAGQHLLALTSGGKQPMICSEFVYRCYDEALPGTLDLFGLSIRREATPEGIRKPGRRHAADRVHPESLLATAMERHQRGGRAVVRTEAVKASNLEPLIRQYLREATDPTTESVPATAADAVDSDVAAAVSTFAAQWQRAKRPTGKTAATEGLDLGAALAGLYRTAADFVTPGDLLRTESLMTLGTLGAK